jgi:hypothetical protein
MSNDTQASNQISDQSSSPKQEVAKAFYNSGVSFGMVFLALGLFWSPLLWVGIGALLLPPLLIAIQQANQAHQQGQRALVLALALAFLGIIVAVVVGLAVKK